MQVALPNSISLVYWYYQLDRRLLDLSKLTAVAPYMYPAPPPWQRLLSRTTALSVVTYQA